MTRLVPWLVLVALAGCRCAEKGGVPDAGAPGPDAAWLAGRLGPETGSPRDGGTLVVRLPLEPNGLTRLHDRFNEGTMARLTVGALYETLARVDHSRPGGPLVPLLAERWEESGDHLSLTVHLRDGVRFHDGTPLTSRDVKATADLVLDPSRPTAAFRASLDALAAVETPDAHTVVVRWKRPWFLSARTFLAALPVMPAHALEGDFDTLPIHRAPIGTGPFRFAKWEPGVALTLERHEGRAHVERLVFRFVKDDTAAVQAWERGEFDVMTRVPAAAWRGSEAQPWAWRGYQRVAFAENAYAWIGFNQRQPRFADARVRRALGLLFPADLVAKTVDLGLEPRVTCPYYPESPSCDPSVLPLAFDVPAARALLDEAGFRDADGDGVREREGERLAFSFLAAAQSTKMAKVLPLYLDALKEAGIDARIETVDVSAYMGRVRAHDFDAMALSWSAPDLVQDLYPALHSSQAEGGQNFLGFADPEVDALLEKIRVEFDEGARHALEQALHRRVYEQQAYLFMGRRPALDALKRRVHGLVPSLAGYDYAAAWVQD